MCRKTIFAMLIVFSTTALSSEFMSTGIYRVLPMMQIKSPEADIRSGLSEGINEYYVSGEKNIFLQHYLSMIEKENPELSEMEIIDDLAEKLSGK